jgi:class 3 adenylate cyclase
MGWDYERSRERVAEESERIRESDIVIEPLRREMDLGNLSPTNCRLVHGVHLYADVRNLPKVIGDGLMRRDDFKRLLRYLHVLRCEQRHITQQAFEGDKIQVQGAKFHGLLFKPYDDDGTLAWQAVLMGITFYVLFRRALPEVFDHYKELVGAFGLELGDSLVTNIGQRGERELISIGRAANLAARILGPAHTLTIGQDLYTALPSRCRRLFSPVDGCYRLRCDEIDDAEDLLAEEGISWSADGAVRRMTARRDELPLDDIVVAEARERINLDDLGPKRAKVCDGATIFVDIDGYTALVDRLIADPDALRRAVKVLHLFRYELQQVTASDFDGVAIQHQGDRLQALVHLPDDDAGRVQRKAVEMCVSYNSSVQDVLREYCASLGEFRVAIGCAFSKTAVARLGVRGDLDAGCFGDAVPEAERIQGRMRGGEIGLAAEAYDAITGPSLRDAFEYDEDRRAWVASGLTWAAIEDQEQSQAYHGSSAAVYSSLGSILVGRTGRPEDRPLKVTRPWWG